MYSIQKKLTLKARQKNPDSPPELISQYQVVVNVLRHYSVSSVTPNDDYFRNLHKAPRTASGFSIVDRWAKVKKLLKGRVYLIVIRMKSFQRNLQTAGLGPRSPYTVFLVIWVASAALIVLFNIVYLVLTLSFADIIPESFIVMQCLIHINVRVHKLLLDWKSWQSYVFV